MVGMKVIWFQIEVIEMEGSVVRRSGRLSSGSCAVMSIWRSGLLASVSLVSVHNFFGTCYWD